MTSTSLPDKTIVRRTGSSHGSKLPQRLSRFPLQQRGHGRKLQLLPQHQRRCRHGQLMVSAAIKDVVGVVLFSAIPFAATQALADSSVGKKLQDNLEAQKAGLKAEEAKRAKAEQECKSDSMWFGPDRPKWLGPLSYEYPAWLTGEVPGDYGYDPLGLGRAPEGLDRNLELEVLHSRWAMLGAFGALLPEVLQYSGTTTFVEPVWWRVGGAKLEGEDLNYFGVPGLRIAGGQGILIIAFCQVLLMFGPEYARSCGIEALEPLGLYLPGDKNYPGSWLFDPLGLSKDVESFIDLQVKEAKHGRLAMVAWLGFFVQAAVTRQGPVQNLLDFWADPAHNNVLKYLLK